VLEQHFIQKIVIKSYNYSNDIPIFSMNNDLVYRDVIKLLIATHSEFNFALHQTAKLQYETDLKINLRGKP
jgi:hypothetical protein